MNWKIVSMFLLSFMLVFSVFAGCTQQEDKAVENVRKLVEKLPSVEKFAAMEDDEKLVAYTATQNAYDAYKALSEEQQKVLTKELAAMEELFHYFNAQIMPLS